MKVIRTTTILALTILLALGLAGCKKSLDSPENTEPSYYIGNINTYKFHRPSCSYLPNPENRTTFETRSEAVNAGYSPCEHCDP